jgi:hypothetical protein
MSGSERKVGGFPAPRTENAISGAKRQQSRRCASRSMHLARLLLYASDRPEMELLFHSSIARSLPPVASWRPSGENATANTGPM